MITQQIYLTNTNSSILSNSATCQVETFEKMCKRLYKTEPTLVSCQYKPELLRKSIEKFEAYRHKLGTCILLVAKFYLSKVAQVSFNFRQVEPFSTTNLHGVFSQGFKLVDRIDPKNGKVVRLKNAKHNNYSEEINFITGQFLILERKASLQNGPALWSFKQLDSDDVILIEIAKLVDYYMANLNDLISLFHDARFQESTEINPNFISDEDLDFMMDVLKIWMK